MATLSVAGFSTFTYSFAGGSLVFNTPFALGVLSPAHVQAYVVGELDGLGDQIYRACIYNATSGTTTVVGPLPNPCDVVLQRTVPKDVLFLSFASGADVTRTNIDVAVKYTLMALHETLDGRWANVAFDALTEAVVDAISARDVALSAMYAAQVSQAASEAWAQSATAPDEFDPTSKSSKTWAAEAAGSASNAVASAIEAARLCGPWLDTVSALIADTSLTYTPAQPSTVSAGDYVRTRKEGFSYRVETAVFSGADVTTAGGVRLTVVPSMGVVSVAAYGAVGDGIADDTAPCQKAIATGWHVVFPSNEYKISASLEAGDQKIYGRGTFSARAQTRLIVVGNIPAFINTTDYWNQCEIEGFFVDYGLTTPVASAGNDQKIGFNFTNALAGGTTPAWPEQIRITNCTIQGGWYGFYDDTGTYQSVVERVEARNCKTGFYKQNGTTIVFINCFARGDGWLEASPKQSEMGFFIREVLGVVLIGCAADGLTPAGEAYAETANMFEGARGVTITGWDAESNDIGPNKSYMRITSGTADIRGFIGYDNTLRAEIGEESTLILNDAANVSFGGMTSLNPADLVYVGADGVPIAIKTINDGRTLVSASVVRTATGGTPGAAFALLGNPGTSVDYVATETDGLVSGASELVSVARLASAALGSLGTTGMFLNATIGLIAEGDIVPGSSLIWCSAGGGITGVDSPDGSWMCLGSASANAFPAVPNADCVSIFKRVS